MVDPKRQINEGPVAPLSQNYAPVNDQMGFDDQLHERINAYGSEVRDVFLSSFQHIAKVRKLSEPKHLRIKRPTLTLKIYFPRIAASLAPRCQGGLKSLRLNPALTR